MHPFNAARWRSLFTFISRQCAKVNAECLLDKLEKSESHVLTQEGNMLISSLMYRNLEPDEFRTERVVTFQNCLSNAQQTVKSQLRNYPKHVRLPRLPMLQTETALNESRINNPLSAYRVASVESTSHCVRNVSRTTNHQSIVCVNAASLESPRHCVRIV